MHVLGRARTPGGAPPAREAGPHSRRHPPPVRSGYVDTVLAANNRVAADCGPSGSKDRSGSRGAGAAATAPYRLVTALERWRPTAGMLRAALSGSGAGFAPHALPHGTRSPGVHGGVWGSPASAHLHMDGGPRVARWVRTFPDGSRGPFVPGRAASLVIAALSASHRSSLLLLLERAVRGGVSWRLRPGCGRVLWLGRGRCRRSGGGRRGWSRVEGGWRHRGTR